MKEPNLSDDFYVRQAYTLLYYCKSGSPREMASPINFIPFVWKIKKNAYLCSIKYKFIYGQKFLETYHHGLYRLHAMAY